MRRKVVLAAEPRGGVITRRRLLLVHELTPRQIDRMIDRGELWPLHPGVYAVGRPSVTEYGRAWAAILATRGTSDWQHPRALGGASAAALAGFRDHPAMPEVIVVGAVLEVPGVVIRRTRRLDPSEIRVDDQRLPWTAWFRTLTDLAGRSTRAELSDDLARCEEQKLLVISDLQEAIRRGRGRPGLRNLRAELAIYEQLPEAEYKSVLERLGRRLLQEAAIECEVNGPVALADGSIIKVDLLLRDERLAIELDGSQHLNMRQRQTDHRRDRELQKLGYDILRFTWYDVKEHPARVVADIVALLDRRARSAA